MTGRLSVRRRALAALERRLNALGDRVVADAAAREQHLAVTIEDLGERLGALEAVAGAADERAGAGAAQLAARAATLDDQLGALGERIAALEHRLGDELAPMLRAVVDDEAGNRRRLWALRDDPDYALAYTEDEPLVSVAIATHDRLELLLERSLPSVLGQTYERLEVTVVGDAAPPAVGAAVARIGDPRITYINLPTRVRGPEGRHWLTAATQTRNEGYRVARGRWTLDFDDDDALHPDAVAVLLEHARVTRAEVAYGDIEQHAPDGTVERLGAFPPAPGAFSLSAALVHSGLRIFAREHVAAAMGVPGDWYRAERMLRAGVRFAHRPGPVFAYYPTFLWGGRPDPPPA
ncbi:hypothetical protein DSM104299_03337 [Baekduia alba]|uniref:glycosyltransferase n=1 Tax=Baekduia alba TaxID=2997333 RepID=UPI0023427105|nr:glycosyltransferase [Baekduia alba]WCB94599.1 hypothetical protein DSM104299_03337 [Baekduia alba]